jgi:hypothetical protein
MHVVAIREGQLVRREDQSVDDGLVFLLVAGLHEVVHDLTQGGAGVDHLEAVSAVGPLGLEETELLLVVGLEAVIFLEVQDELSSAFLGA